MIISNYDQIFQWKESITVVAFKHKAVDRERGLGDILNILHIFLRMIFGENLEK